MKPVITLLLLVFSLVALAKENPTTKAQPNVVEGKRLYRSEMASWYGTDLFLENFKDRDSIGGYFSYADKELTKCIFFGKGDVPKVIGTISFDSTYNVQSAILNLDVREFLPVEKDIYEIRKVALATINADTFFKQYQKTLFNLIPLVDGGERKVYILTGPKENGVVIFGNDYLLTFDKRNKLLTKRQLHKNIIPITYGEPGKETIETEGAIHSHLPETGEFITATDVCTLMLYGKFAKWKQHTVVSKKYLNIWNCQTNQLVVIPMNTVKKINKHNANTDAKTDE